MTDDKEPASRLEILEILDKMSKIFEGQSRADTVSVLANYLNANEEVKHEYLRRCATRARMMHPDLTDGSIRFHIIFDLAGLGEPSQEMEDMRNYVFENVPDTPCPCNQCGQIRDAGGALAWLNEDWPVTDE